jgi:hypothetical protein
MKIRVKYANYRVGRSDVKIIGEEDVPVEKTTPPQKP